MALMSGEGRPLGDGDIDEVICACRGITRGQIQQGIARQECRNLADMASRLGAGAACGSCSPALRELLGEDSVWTEVVATFGAASTDASDEQRIQQLDLHLPEPLTYPVARAGQHVTVQGLIDGRWVSRTYTIINPGAQTGVVSIAVRRVPGGQFTPWLLQASNSPKRLRISVPAGDDYWAGNHLQTVCMVGGIGITMARSLLAGCPDGSRIHLDYSARSLPDQVFINEHEELKQQCADFTMVSRTDDVHGYIRHEDVVSTTQRFPNARYVMCGPPAYISAVHSWLRKSGIPETSIHVEKFFLQTHSKPGVARSWKTYGYQVGAALALLPGLWLIPDLAHLIPHHEHNPGHEKLECSDCHRSAPGTLRQQLQAKLDFRLGRREADAPFIFKPVNNQICMDCHKRSNDYHPSHRFLEPRFAAVRETVGPQLCYNCHREHNKVRLTRTDPGFCASCHAELVLKKDPAQPTHAELIKAQRWETCLGCHDFHNNHGWKAPHKLTDAISPDRIRDYFQSGPSPYGEVQQKANQKLPAPSQMQ